MGKKDESFESQIERVKESIVTCGDNLQTMRRLLNELEATMARSMSKVLKTKRVFIDTTEFVDVSFNVDSPQLREITRLCCAKELTLNTTAITKAEILKRIEIESKINHKKLAELAKATGLTAEDLQTLTAIADKLNPTDIVKAHGNAIAKFFSDCSTTELEIPKTCINEVFNRYFTAKPPFGSKKKKAEFPDAFVLQALKAATAGAREPMYVVSDDEDFAKACSENPKLLYKKSISHFLDEVHTHDAAVKHVRATLRHNSLLIDQKLEKFFNSIPVELAERDAVLQDSSIAIADTLDELIVSCDEETAAVEFACLITVDAHFEYENEEGEIERDWKRTQEFASITLEFHFDPKDPSIFEVQSYAAPTKLEIRESHDF
jgi:hypothetical protein